MEKTRAVVLLSGGQDSTTCLHWAISKFGAKNVLGLSMYYGQRHEAELAAAETIANMAGVPRSEMDLAFLGFISDSALVAANDKVIEGQGGIPDAEMPEGLPTSFVPGRNLLFLAAAASFAVKHGAKHIVTGVCQTDYSGYPDCRLSFIHAMQAAVNEAMPSSSGPITIHTPLMHLTKAETVQLARTLGGDCWKALGYSVTCYNGQRPGCGKCPACELRAAGFKEAGEVDPANG